MRKLFQKAAKEHQSRLLKEDGRIQFTEVEILGTSEVAGKKLWQIHLPKEVIIGCIYRGEETIVPCGNTVLEPGDTVVVISRVAQEKEALRVLEER